MNDISLKQLEIFVAVVEYGGFTRAAEELFFNQSTVSAHISLLEQALGKKLFVRSNRRHVRLTKEGEQVYPIARRILNDCAAPNNEHYRAFRERGVYGRELLLEEPFVSREEGSGTDTSLQNYLRTLGLSHDMLHVVARVDDPEAIKQMVSGGVGVAVLSALAVEQEVQNGTLLAFEMDKSALKRTIYLITLKSQQLSRMEQKLVDFLKSPHRRKRAEAQN